MSVRALALLVAIALALPAVAVLEDCHEECEESDCRDCAACVQCVPPCPGEPHELVEVRGIPSPRPVAAEAPVSLPLPPAREVFHVPLSCA